MRDTKLMPPLNIFKDVKMYSLHFWSACAVFNKVFICKKGATIDYRTT